MIRRGAAGANAPAATTLSHEGLMFVIGPESGMTKIAEMRAWR